METKLAKRKVKITNGSSMGQGTVKQEFPHFLGTNKITPKAEWKAAKQRASEPPLFWLSQQGNGQQRAVALSSP